MLLSICGNKTEFPLMVPTKGSIVVVIPIRIEEPCHTHRDKSHTFWARKGFVTGEKEREEKKRRKGRQRITR